ncbi:protein adenylyltransferase SelO family protein [Nitrincola schmidtii]|uniref:protein adenylyltransferase SelO family protein n=1 Tax=Nitrincola schmidtii TaxID=1730894 RepID=UPI00124D278E|nr:protein adenylyltransferase SelO family protein [Nitrincola schmidtii]
MLDQQNQDKLFLVNSLDDLATLVDYSLLDTLHCDPDATDDGVDHHPRQVFSGHYVPVKPTPIENPEYVAHSKLFFDELGFSNSLAQSEAFTTLFSGNLDDLPEPMRQQGWACGYALSIFGTEYTQQCPFQTGNGYGDGRAVSVVEAVIQGQRWEMQLKGGGRTPYCRGADGRAVLRSSVREFLAQEHMHALGVPTSRSLTLYVSTSEKVKRPWYSEGSHAVNPDRMVLEPVAISTRVAPSFIRVGQLELFGRRARKNEHPLAMEELKALVLHLIDREYAKEIDSSLDLPEKVLRLAKAFRNRLTSLVANWIRVGYCQGNFNSDNCAAGGFTLDYGPYGFCQVFHPYYQPWTGGGRHFSFFHQPVAAERNFQMFCSALRPLLTDYSDAQSELEQIHAGFIEEMEVKLEKMWASKLGLSAYDADVFAELFHLMMQTPVDYTLFFRELSNLPNDLDALKKSFYTELNPTADIAELNTRWLHWFTQWKTLIEERCATLSKDELSLQMKQINPKYTLREWLVAPAYQQASEGHYDLLREIQQIMTAPYDEQSIEVEAKYYRLQPTALLEVGGLSHYSCSS